MVRSNASGVDARTGSGIDQWMRRSSPGQFLMGTVAHHDGEVPRRENVVQVQRGTRLHRQLVAPRSGERAGLDFGDGVRAGRRGGQPAVAVPNRYCKLTAGRILRAHKHHPYR